MGLCWVASTEPFDSVADFANRQNTEVEVVGTRRGEPRFHMRVAVRFPNFGDDVRVEQVRQRSTSRGISRRIVSSSSTDRSGAVSRNDLKSGPDPVFATLR